MNQSFLDSMNIITIFSGNIEECLPTVQKIEVSSTRQFVLLGRCFMFLHCLWQII